jgi:hypothetical protein
MSISHAYAQERIAQERIAQVYRSRNVCSAPRAVASGRRRRQSSTSFFSKYRQQISSASIERAFDPAQRRAPREYRLRAFGFSGKD